MQFDDRLATVLRMRADGERSAGTQYRQLLDLLGSAPGGADDGLLQSAYSRLEALSAILPPTRRAAIVREPGTRLRNPELVVFLAAQEPALAAAAMASAQLSPLQWEDAVPSLPVPARALLRHRADLPRATVELLARIGVRGLGLPKPDGARALRVEPAAERGDVLELEPALELGAEENAGIGALVRRIEAFQRARANATAASDAPLLPLEEKRPERPARIQAFDFATNGEGRIDWADPALAPMTLGIALTSRQPDAPARPSREVIDAMRRRQPVRGGRIALDGAPSIAGEWRIDATPHFTFPGGVFAGYRGRMRRPFATAVPAPASNDDNPADRMRQLLHELRTPVNAIQGYAEVIHQQLFGPAPHEYRALAAAIAGDAARILAGFDELDRLARLETGAIELDEGTADFAPIVEGIARQLGAVLAQRGAALELERQEQPCLVGLLRNDAELLAWRILATLCGAAGAGEDLRIRVAPEGAGTVLEIDLPASLASRAEIFDSAAPIQPQAVTSGMFGAGFALRLARAEARAAGGELSRLDDVLRLELPASSANRAIGRDKPMDYDGNFAETG
ncbi:MAG TPA: histidine kinase dimerization/phospho-acceptor domain-containing protein [Sphingomonadaceae bacterium]